MRESHNIVLPIAKMQTLFKIAAITVLMTATAMKGFFCDLATEASNQLKTQRKARQLEHGILDVENKMVDKLNSWLG